MPFSRIGAMRFLFALLLPALAADLPQDPIEQKMVMSEEEQRGSEELERAQELMDKLKALRQGYAQDGDLERYARERQPLVTELWHRFERLMNVRTDIKIMHTKSSIINALSVASELNQGKSKHAEGMVGTRMVQYTRLVSFDSQLRDMQDRAAQALKDENVFFAAEKESAAQRKRMTLIAASLAVLALGAGALLLWLRRKG